MAWLRKTPSQKLEDELSNSNVPGILSRRSRFTHEWFGLTSLCHNRASLCIENVQWLRRDYWSCVFIYPLTGIDNIYLATVQVPYWVVWLEMLRKEGLVSGCCSVCYSALLIVIDMPLLGLESRILRGLNCNSGNILPLVLITLGRRRGYLLDTRHFPGVK